jgi:hydroxymethylpyrimidine pyrophosphatase-like HAD family hydrolase
MKLRLLALDYDGTIAAEGTLDPAVEAALRRVTQPDSHANPCSESNAQATTLVP